MLHIATIFCEILSMLVNTENYLFEEKFPIFLNL